MLKSLLLLCAEMEDGLGLLVAIRPHDKTPEQLLYRAARHYNVDLWHQAAKNGHVHVLEWLSVNSPISPSNTDIIGGPLKVRRQPIYSDGDYLTNHVVIEAAAEEGHSNVLKWLKHSRE